MKRVSRFELGAVAVDAVDAAASSGRVMTSTHTQARVAEARHPLHGVEDGLLLLVRLSERQGLV